MLLCHGFHFRCYVYTYLCYFCTGFSCCFPWRGVRAQHVTYCTLTAAAIAHAGDMCATPGNASDVNLPLVLAAVCGLLRCSADNLLSCCKANRQGHILAIQKYRASCAAAPCRSQFAEAGQLLVLGSYGTSADRAKHVAAVEGRHRLDDACGAGSQHGAG